MSDLPEPTSLDLTQPAVERDEVPRRPSGLAALFLDETWRLRTFWRLSIFGIGFVVVQFAVNIVLAIGIVAFLFASQSELVTNGVDAHALASWQYENLTVLMAIAALPTTVATFGLVAGCRELLDRRSLTSLGFVWPRPRAALSLTNAFALGAVPILASAWLVWAFGGFQLVSEPVTWKTWILIPTFIVMAFMEEIVFRSYVLQNLLDIRRKVFGVIFSSLVFWLVHFLNPSAWSSPWVGVNLFGAGVVLALAYLVSGNIWFPTVLHFSWNFAQGVILGIPVSGIPVDGLINFDPNPDAPAWLTGGEFGLEASAVCTATQVVLIAVFLAILSRRRTHRADYCTTDCQSVHEPGTD